MNQFTAKIEWVFPWARPHLWLKFHVNLSKMFKHARQPHKLSRATAGGGHIKEKKLVREVLRG